MNERVKRVAENRVRSAALADQYQAHCEAHPEEYEEMLQGLYDAIAKWGEFYKGAGMSPSVALAEAMHYIIQCCVPPDA